MRMHLFATGEEKYKPRALKYRPQRFDEFYGQEHLLGEKGVLRPLLAQGRRLNAIFRGPPGTGKTTLAELIATTLEYSYSYLNATKASILELKTLAQKAFQQKQFQGKQTLLFLDEIHRFTTVQQDALLEDLEDGNLLLIGATSENPYYSLNNALLSRCLAFEFKKIDPDSIARMLKRIVASEKLEITDEILYFLAEMVEGDARAAIQRLELMHHFGKELTINQLKELLPQAKSYHKTQDKYDMISAMIKSIRGSDPDAAIYRLAAMLSGGEDPKYLARRLVILAAEDVGLANPQALPIATAALQAAKELGMPEIRIPLAEVVIYLALSPKSNSAYTAINTALAHLKKSPIEAVPHHLTSLGKDAYKYPHDYPKHFVDQAYREGTSKYYVPCQNKFEDAALERIEQLRKSK